MTNQNQRKSFIIHKDSLDILDQLNDEQAGRLFKAISCYQKTGNFEHLDQFTKIILTPFISQFKRDEEKHSISIIQGKIGNLKKYHPEIYLKVINEEIALDEAESLAYPDRKLSLRPPITPDQVGSLSVSVSVSDSVSVSNSKNDIISSVFRSDLIKGEIFPLAKQKENSALGTEEERKKKSGAQRKKKEFTPPTLEEVKAYCAERKNSIDAKYFFDLYSVANWEDTKGNQIKNWKQKIITWESRQGAKQEQTLANRINQICGADLISSTKETETEIKVFCKSPTAKSKLFDLNEEARNKIKALFGNKKFEFLC